MTDLIQISTGGQGSPVVSARELHAFLEVKSKFADWIKNRIIKYGFLEGADYVEIEEGEGFSKSLEKGGRPTVDFAITLDMAKELAMVENNQKGREARRYFIEKEKQLTQAPTPTAGLNEQVIIQLLAQSNQLLANQQQQMNQLRADVDALLQTSKTGKSLSTRSMAPLRLSPPKRTLSVLRQLVVQKVNQYSTLFQVEPSETYNYLYKRLYNLWGINVYRIPREKGGSYLDGLEKAGHLERLLSLVESELTFTEE